MVTKSKLKMALLRDQPVDFQKEHQKKMAKQACKSKKQKIGVASHGDDWEDVDEEGDEEVGGGTAGLSDDEEDADGAEAALPASVQLNLAGIDDSDSASSSGVEDHNGLDAEGDGTGLEENDEGDEDEEDIPMSDLEDLPEEEKEDIIPHQRLTINNLSALTTSLKRIALPLASLPFSEHQSLTSSTPVAIADVSDDLNRELAFYAQSLDAAKRARGLLKDEGAAWSRPKDYFAEMVKADEHMERVKGRLVEEAGRKKAAAEARKQRDLKKFGKQVQVAKIQERDKEKRSTLEKIKSLKRKRQGADNPETEESAQFDVALDDAADDGGRKRNRMESRGKSGDNKRAKKDAKYGHGGKKRFAKSGDAMSSGDLSGFSVKGMKARNAGRSGGRPGAKAQRPGKARRAGAGRK